jgi:hypothetical protein
MWFWIVCNFMKSTEIFVAKILAEFPETRFSIYKEPKYSYSTNNKNIEIIFKPSKSEHFYSYFHFCFTHYNNLPENILMLQGHDAHWHQRNNVVQIIKTLNTIVPNCNLKYVNLNNKLFYDWQNGKMLKLVKTYWRNVSQLIEESHKTEPTSIVELSSAQAYVHRSRILKRKRKVYENLLQYSKNVIHHSSQGYALEGMFHHIFGEPWVRPFIKKHYNELASYIKRNELEIRNSTANCT